MKINSNLTRLKSIGRLLWWLFLIAGAVAVFQTGYELVMYFAFGQTHEAQPGAEQILFSAIHIFAVVFFLALTISVLRRLVRTVKWLDRFFGWLVSWRGIRAGLVTLAVLATLIAIAYTVENWRGKRAWEQCKRELEAKGEVLDWSAYIPPPIPDEQNILKAPKMTEWFVRPKPGSGYTNELNAKLGGPPFDSAKRADAKSPILVARLAVGSPNSSATNGADAVLRLDAPDTRERLGKLIQDAVGPSSVDSLDFTFVRNPLSQIQPRRVSLQAEKPLSAGDVSELLSTNLIPANVGLLRVETGREDGSLHVVLAAKSTIPPATIPAEEYLAWSDKLEPEFNLIREALKRPHIRTDGDFQRPFEVRIASFVSIRNVAQTAAQRAQCCLLLGRPEEAFRELSLIYELRRLLRASPAVLVSAMIDVAICGLYVDVIADGLRLQAWHEPELVALQEQLRQIDLPPAVVDSFRTERAAICHTLETTTAKEMGRIFSFTDPNDGWWKQVTNPMFLVCAIAPRGWFYQNLTRFAALEQRGIDAFAHTNLFVLPRKFDDADREVQILRSRGPFSPYTVLAAIGIPNFSRASQTTARNQTKVNQALIACALERHRLARGSYPETLDALVPQFIGKLPIDIIGGQPLHYRRTDDGRFLLYSIGWNEKDDGGQVVWDAFGRASIRAGVDQPDWVWASPQK